MQGPAVVEQLVEQQAASRWLAAAKGCEFSAADYWNSISGILQASISSYTKHECKSGSHSNATVACDVI
jgi:hypothetical protein